MIDFVIAHPNRSAVILLTLAVFVVLFLTRRAVPQRRKEDDWPQ